MGCLGLALLSAALALMSLTYGAVCVGRDDLWDCAALLTVVPGGLLTVALLAGYVAARSGVQPRESGDIGYERMEGEPGADE